MPVFVTSRKFYDEYTGVPGGGVEYLPGRIMDKITEVIEFHVKWSAENKRLIFDAGTKTITNGNDLDFSSFIEAGFKVGDTFDVVGTVSNNGSYTIAAVESDVITTVEALVNETDEDASLFGTTPVTAIDFLANEIENSTSENYLSLTDINFLQRYTASGVDATDTVTPVSFKIGSDSFGWVTEDYTGDVSDVTEIVGLGIVSYEQRFKITRVFILAPFFLNEQVDNFSELIAPDYFQQRRALREVVQIDAKFNEDDPLVPHTGGVEDVKGLTGWFNQNAVGSRPEYFVESIAYVDDVSALPVDKHDINKVTNVTLVIKSRSGLFTDDTELVLNHIYCPLDVNDYQNTQTSLLQNYYHDRKFLDATDSASGGDREGTDYQSLKTIVTTKPDANTINITFKLDYSAALRTFLKGKGSENRNYAIVVATQNIAKTATSDSDRVAILCDFQNADYDQRDDSLINGVEDFRCYRFPNIGVEERNTINGFEGDPYYVISGFRLQTAEVNGVTPTMTRVRAEIVAIKSGKEDFVLEQKEFNAEFIRKLLNTQQPNIVDQRGFVTFANDPFNESFLIRAQALDSGTEKGFFLQHAFVLRYEDWVEVLTSITGSAVDIFNSVESVSHRWANYATDGWALKFRETIDVQGYDGFVSSFVQSVPITIKKAGELPEAGPVFESFTEYFDTDDVEINGVLEDEPTKIRSTFVGDFSSVPAGYVNSPWGYIFADQQFEGNIFIRRFASSERPSESDTPFTATGADVLATTSYANGGVRINIFGTDKVVLETLYDPTIDNWRAKRGSIVIYSRIGFKNENTDCPIQDEETGLPILDTELKAILDEDCP